MSTMMIGTALGIVFFLSFFFHSTACLSVSFQSCCKPAAVHGNKHDGRAFSSLGRVPRLRPLKASNTTSRPEVCAPIKASSLNPWRATKTAVLSAPLASRLASQVSRPGRRHCTICVAPLSRHRPLCVCNRCAGRLCFCDCQCLLSRLASTATQRGGRRGGHLVNRQAGRQAGDAPPLWLAQLRVQRSTPRAPKPHLRRLTSMFSSRGRMACTQSARMGHTCRQ